MGGAARRACALELGHGRASSGPRDDGVDILPLVLGSFRLLHYSLWDK